MAKGMTVTGMVVAVLMLLLFALDLTVKFPFKQASWAMDLAFIFAALGLGLISWTTWREVQ